MSEMEPYIGPRPFETSDTGRFFGRESETNELASCIGAHFEVVLYAQSGSGKTSLINASLIPHLVKTGREVLCARVQGPEPRAGQEVANIYAWHTIANWMGAEVGGKRPESLSIAQYLAQRPRSLEEDGDARPRVLIFDQFEELFTLYPARWKERRAFFEQLRDALKAEPSLCVLLSTREDRVAELDAHADILPGRLRTRYRLERLRRPAALEAIVKPLEGTPYRFADKVPDAVVDELLEIQTTLPTGEVIRTQGEFVEPVQLQVVCRSLWNALEEGETEITKEHLQECGDLDVALRAYFEEAVTAAAASGVSEDRLRRWFAEKLITPAGTRGLLFQGKTETDGIPNTAVDVLDQMHVVRPEQRGQATWYELTHDRFIGPIRESNRAWFDKRRRDVADADPTDRGIRVLETDSGEVATHGTKVEEGAALCLSGGGFRSMLFLLGSVWRLNELGMLGGMQRLCAVSGGAIVAAALGREWARLRWEGGRAADFRERVVAPLRALALQNVDTKSALLALLGTAESPIADELDRHLLGGATLQDLPDEPRFVFNATNIGSGGIWTFSKGYMGDPLVGRSKSPVVRLASVVAATNAIPIPSFFKLKVDRALLEPSLSAPPAEDKDKPSFTLGDGGFADPIAIASAWRRYRTILIADGSAWNLDPQPPNRLDWTAGIGRLFDILHNGIRAGRKRQAIESFVLGVRKGSYWSVRSDIEEFAAPDVLPCPPERTRELAAIPSRLKGLSGDLQERLINWGYAMCDAAIRRYVTADAAPPPGFPYPKAGV